VVREDRALNLSAFAETLRYTPAVQMIVRQATRDVPLSGGAVTEGSTVTCLIGAANRDRWQWRNPDEFSLSREDLNDNAVFTGATDHVAFALEAHFSVGAPLAKTEVEAATNHLLDALPQLRLDEEFAPEEREFSLGV
jgi:pulcherriminic acid synthase